MRIAPGARGSSARLLAIYAVITLVPVLVLGVVLAVTFRSQLDGQGLAQGRSEAVLVAQTAVAPQLSGTPLSGGLSKAEQRRLHRLVWNAVGARHVLRLRLRDLQGHVVFSDDGSGFGGPPDDQALAAASGRVVARLTRLNTDSNDTGQTGVRAVEVYQPLTAGTPRRRIGVLELYLPYAPISRDVSSDLHTLYVDLAIGLAVLYLVLFAITVSVSRGLRRQLAVNAFLAEYDTLTQLPNRTLFHRRAERAVAAAAPGRAVALAIVDLDRFKDVNDTLGHHNGDRLLVELGGRLAAAVGTQDTVARLGGDEFGLILWHADDPEEVLAGLRAMLAEPVELNGLPLSAEASIGYVIAPDDGVDVDVLMQRADLAMYGAKAHHAGAMRYEASLDRYDAATLSLVGELRRAIDADQLVLHYQPQATLPENRVSAVEALVRWQHPEHGLLEPDRFLPLAEQTDVIDKLTHWVLRTALRDLRDLSEEHEELRVAVNVSARNIARSRFAEEVLSALRDTGSPADRLIVEVTETALLADPPRAAAVLGTLSAAGVAISIDDFGTGQTSLAHLSRLPIRELKIDRGFVTDMLDSPGHAAIVRSIVELGHNLSLRVVGEGVETDDTLARLTEYECDVAQGYLLARPMPMARLQAWLTDLETLSAPPRAR